MEQDQQNLDDAEKELADIKRELEEVKMRADNARVTQTFINDKS